ncbi:MAG: hypothetical protein HZA54_08180 [Planctomycetes bacterium]|nr:hypothetical protein [Planctomycetota bacterium]
MVARKRGEFADAQAIQLVQACEHVLPDAGEEVDRERVEEGTLGSGRHLATPVGLGDARRHAAHQLVGGDPEGGDEGGLADDGAADARRRVRGRAEHALGAGKVEHEVAGSGGFEARREAREAGVERAGGAVVELGSRGEDTGVAADPPGATERHALVHAGQPRLARQVEHRRAPGRRRGDQHRAAAQARRERALDGDVERENVQVDEHGTLLPTRRADNARATTPYRDQA